MAGPIIIYPDDKGQIGLAEIGENPPANRKLVWIQVDGLGQLLAYRWYNPASGLWEILGNVEILDLLTSFKTKSALSANQGRVLKGLIDSLTSAIAQVNAEFSNYQELDQKNQANGYAGLDALGKIPSNLLNFSGFSPQGSWDASTGSEPSVAPQDGQIWSVSVAGNTDLDGNDNWQVGDFAYFANGKWQLLEGFNPSSYNALDQLNAGFVLDARQGKVLKDLIDAQAATIAALDAQLQSALQDITNLQTSLDDLTDEVGTKENVILRRRGAADSSSRFSHADLTNVPLTDMDVFVSGQLLQGNMISKHNSNTIQLPPGNSGVEVLIKIYKPQ